MIDQACKPDKLILAFGTMIFRLLVDRAFQMLVQSIQASEFAATEAAFVAIAIPGPISGDGFCITVVGQKLLADDMVGVDLPNESLNFSTVYARFVNARFEMMCDACEIDGL